MISSNPIDGLTGIEPHYKANKYPYPGHVSLPNMFWVGLWIASRGGGKTYSCAQLLKMYETHQLYDPKTHEECVQRVILMSPTVEANPVWTSLKNLDPKDIHGRYSDRLLSRVIDDIKTEAEATETFLRRMRVWRRAMRAKSIDQLSKKDVEVLMETQMTDPREWGEQPKYTKPVVNFLILDDLVGSDAFKAVGKSELTQVLLRNRHMRLNIAILAQSLKSVPRTIRMNASVFVLYRFANVKVIFDLYEEVSNLLTEREFEEVYKYATREDHGALIIDQTQKDKSQRLKNGWDNILSFNQQPQYEDDVQLSSAEGVHTGVPQLR